VKIRGILKQSYKGNLTKIYLFKFFTSLHLVGGILIPFFRDWGGLDFTQILFLQSWFSFWIFILEIPTGAVADFFGRKQSLALGAIVNAIAALVYGSFPSFYIFLLAEFLWAISAALLSGADNAFTYDTLRKLGKTKSSKRVFSKIESIGKTALLIGSPIGSIVAASLGLNVPNLLMFFPFMLAFAVALTFKEPVSRKVVESKRYLTIIKDGFKYFAKNDILKILAVDTIIISSLAYFMIWFFQPMLERAGVNIVYFGLVHALLVLSQIVIMNSFGKLEKLLGNKKRLLLLSSLLLGAAFMMGSFSNSLPMILLVIVIGGGFGLSRSVLFSSYLNKYIESSKRATVLSTISMFRRFLLVILNPLVGKMADWSLEYTLFALGIAVIVFTVFSRVEEKYLVD